MNSTSSDPGRSILLFSFFVGGIGLSRSVLFSLFNCCLLIVCTFFICSCFWHLTFINCMGMYGE